MDLPTITPEQRAAVMDVVRRAWDAKVNTEDGDKRYGTDRKTADLRVDDFDRMLTVVQEGLAAGRIENARYTDAKFTLSRGFETVVDTLVRVPLRAIRAERPTHAFDDRPKALKDAVDNFYPDFARMPAALARMEAGASVDARLAPNVDVLRAFTPVHEAMAALRKVAVKKLRGKDLAQANATAAASAPPVVESEAVKAVRKVLEEFTQAAADAIRARVLVGVVQRVDAYLKRQDETLAQGKPIDDRFMDEHFTRDLGRYGRTYDSQSAALVDALTDRGDRRDPAKRNVRTRKADFQALAEAVAAKSAKKIQDAFVEKNLRKIGPVCDTFPTVPEIAPGKTEITLQAMTGEIVVTLPDGVGFVARNGIVENVSSLGRAFDQFPLRFHDVAFPDGTKAKFASEKTMRDRFRPVD